MVTGRANFTIAKTRSHLLVFDWYICIWTWSILKVKVMQKEIEHICCYHQRESLWISICTYIWPWPILKVKSKVMHISTATVSQTITDRTNIAIANWYEMAFRLAYLHLILTHSKGQCHVYFDCEYFANDDWWGDITIAPILYRMSAFDWHI